MYQRSFSLISFLLCTTLFLNAQPPAGMGGGFGGGMGQSGRFYGKIVDAGSGKAIPAASVQLVSSKFNMAKRAMVDTLLTGQLTPNNGDFSLENIPIIGEYKLRISAIGYKPYEQKVSFLSKEQQEKLMKAFAQMGGQQQNNSRPPIKEPNDTPKGKNPTGPQQPGKTGNGPNMMEVIKSVFGGDMSQLMSMGDKDLGNIRLEIDAKELENVVVTASKPMMQLGIDRRTFNVDKSLAASGATGTDIMRQIPTINVDIDGNVTVRNASPTLFVDGRPTTLTLDQIPADEIQSVELITNPSAKYDASGGGAAILNIIMKKNRKPGYNGSVRAGIDSRGMPNFGGDISVRSGKFVANASGNFNMRKSLSWSDINTDYIGNANTPPSSITQDIYNVGTGFFGFGRAGVDYLVDNRNTLSLSFNYVRGSFDNEETNDMRYDSFYNPVKTWIGSRVTESDRTFQNFGATLGYKRLFARPGHELTADLNVSEMKNWGTSEFLNQMFNSNGQQITNPTMQITDGSGGSRFGVAQIDYANPISKTMKFEGGLRGQIRTFNASNLNYVYDYTTNDYVLIPRISANYEFTDRVYAAYGILTGRNKEGGKFGYNLGLRIESSNYDGLLTDTKESFSVDFPLSLFPSAFASYKLNDVSDLQFNYSRRINRPNFFQLMPFVDYTDPLNLRVGNAQLSPEFTNSLEMNYSYRFNNNHSILASTYFRHTTDLITPYQYKDLNPVSKDSVIFNTFENAQSATRYGFEVTGTNKLTKKLDVITNLNLYNARINSENLEQDLNNSQTSFFGKITITQKLGKLNNWVVQVQGDYQSRTVLPAGGGGMRGMWMGPSMAGSNGFVNPNYGMDLSVRRDIIKNKNGQGYAGSLTLSMNDIFRTRIFDVTSSSEGFFIQDLARRRDPQVLRLQFNWRFGKMDASLFKRKNMKG
ncbi:MAG TPA: TonB-dependent receptor family protein, partial [Phnomibacter sp.]|nr:TonB-dependent receptor family protein [Phnomibacter sp.]